MSNPLMATSLERKEAIGLFDDKENNFTTLNKIKFIAPKIMLKIPAVTEYLTSSFNIINPIPIITNKMPKTRREVQLTKVPIIAKKLNAE